MDKNNDIFYNGEIFPLNGSLFSRNIFEFNSLDKSLMIGNHRAEIGKITDVIRRFAELNLAKHAIKNLGNGDILILDGLLECDFNNEMKLMGELYDECQKKNIGISALSKTNTWFTENADNFSHLLGEISPFGMWYYYPVAEIINKNHLVNMFFVKLHKNSKHVFRFECFKEQKFNFDRLFGLLANNSRDPIFIGYPYGLIEADKLARVSINETEMLRNSVLARLGDIDVDSLLSSTSAHAILDKISF